MGVEWIYYLVVAVAAALVAVNVSKANLDSREGGATVTKPATNKNIPVYFGERPRVSGIIAYKGTLNANDSDSIQNDLLYYVIVWCEGPVSALGEIYYNDIPSSDPKFTASGGGRWEYHHHFVNGLTATFPERERLIASGFDATRYKFTNLAVSVVRMEWDGEGEAFSGEPNVTADIDRGYICTSPINGLPVYTNNPAFVAHEIISNSLWGYGASEDDYDKQSFIDAYNKTNVLVPKFQGSAGVRELYTCNYKLDTAKNPAEHLDVVLSGCRGHLPEINGKKTLIIEGNDPAESYELIEGETFFGSIQILDTEIERLNQIVGEYISPDHAGKSQEIIFPEPGSPLDLQWLADDGNERLSKKVTLEDKTDPNEVLYHLKQLVYYSRESITCGLVAEPESYHLLHCGYVVNVKSEVFGVSAKPFRVIGKTLREDLRVELILREHQPYIYDIDNEDATPPIPDTTLVDTRPPAPTNIIVSDLYNNRGQVEITWTSDSKLFDVQVYEDGESEPYISTQTRTKSLVLSGMALGDYTVDVRAMDNTGRPSLFPNSTIFSITQPGTPAAPTITIEPGTIIIEPEAPLAIESIYEGVYSLNSGLDPNTDSINLFTRIASGKELVISNTISQTYYIWYRLVTKEGISVWQSTQALGQSVVFSEWIIGTGVPSAGIGSDGDRFLDTDTGDIYSKTSGAWSLDGNLSPSDGDSWLSGAGAPDNANGSDGDMYLNSSNFDLYQKESGVWVLVGNIKGDDGSQGPQGPSGPPGSTGPIGPQGPNGQSGAGWFDSFVAAAANGRTLVVNDIAVDSGSAYRWSGSAWQAATSFIDGPLIVDGAIVSRTIAANAVDATKIDVDDLFAQNITATGFIKYENGLNQTILGGGALIEAKNATGPIFQIKKDGTGKLDGSIINQNSIPYGAISSAEIDRILSLSGSPAPTTGGNESVSFDVAINTTKTLPVIQHGTNTVNIVFQGSMWRSFNNNPGSLSARVTVQRSTNGGSTYTNIQSPETIPATITTEEGYWYAQWDVTKNYTDNPTSGSVLYRVVVDNVVFGGDTAKCSFSVTEQAAGGSSGGGSTAWVDITGKPAYATRWPSFSEITSPPVYTTRWPTAAEAGAVSTSGTAYSSSRLNAEGGHRIGQAARGAHTVCVRNHNGDIGVDNLNYTSLTNVSSRHTKNIRGKIKNPLDTICWLAENAVEEYTYDAEFTTKPDQIHFGFVAEEVEKLLPEMVELSLEGIKSVNVIGTLVATVPAIDVLAKRTKTQAVRIKTLETQVALLIEEVNTLKAA